MQDIEQIYREHSKTVYKYIFCLTQNKEISEEIVQDTFLVAVENIDKFKGDCKITTWLCQIAKFIWFKRSKMQRNDTPLEKMENFILDEDSIEDKVCENEEKIELLKEIQKLDKNTKDVMYLRILGNLEYDEIADIMNKTSNWARVTFWRGKQKIKEGKHNEK